MAWMPPAIIATLISTLVLTFVYFYLYMEYRERFMKIWMLAWVLYSLRFCFMLVYIIIVKNPHILTISEIFSTVSGLCLIWGTYIFIDKKTPGSWFVLASLAIIWMLTVPLLNSSFMILTFLPYLFLGMVYVWTGVLLLRNRPIKTLAGSITGWAFIIWGIHKMDYPFLRPVAWIAPWGYLVAATITLVIAVGILVVYFQKVGNDLKNVGTKYRELVESANSIIMKINMRGEITFFNEYAQKLFGYSEEEVLGKGVLGTILPALDSSGKNHELMLQEALSDDEKYAFNENENICRDGKRIWVSWANKAIYDSDGNKEGILCIGKDISDRKIAEEALRQSNELNQQIINSAQEGIIVYGPDFRYRIWNPEMEKICGVSADKVLGRHPLEIFPFLNDAGLIERLEKIFKGECQKQIEFPFTIPESGRNGWASDTTAPLKNTDGDIIGAIGIVRDVTERRRAEEELRFASLVAEQVSDSVIVTGTDFRIKFVNKATADLFGYREQEMLNKTPDMFNTEPLSDQRQHEIYEAVSSGNTWSGILLNKRKDGSTFFNECSVSPMYGADGDIISYVSIQKDITERIKADERLKKSEAFLARSQSVAHVGSWHLDLSTNKLTWSDENYRIFGFEPGEIEATYETFIECVHPEDRADVKAAYTTAIETNAPYEITHRILRRDGTVRVVHEVSEEIFDENGKAIASIGMTIDITDRTKVEQALRESEERFKGAFKHSSIGMALVSPQGRFISVNDALCGIIGYSEEELLQKTFQEITHPEDLEADVSLVNQMLSGKIETYKLEKRYLHKNGGIVWVLLSVSMVQDQDGTPRYFVSQIQDVTDSRKSQETLIRSLEQEKFATIGKIAGKMAHDFNNVLGIILGTSQLLLTEDIPPDVRSEIEIIMESALKGRDLTSNLLLFAKDQEPKLSQLDINEKIAVVLKSLRTELKRVEVSTTCGSGMENLLADAGLLENALINMIQNSIHAMSKTEKPMLGIKTYTEANNICIEIQDNGCGIPAEWKDRIFDPSVTLKGSSDRIGAYARGIKGSGYGMANVKRCVDKHGGTIQVDTAVGRGTKFKISLPLMKGCFSTEEMAAIRKQVRVEGKRILIVEDEPHLGRILYSMLEKFNHNLALATDGKMALNYLKNNRYDAISLDFVLPDMNGLEIYRKIRETNREIPIIFVSGNFEFMQSMIDLKETDRRMDHLAKPFNNVDYVNKIHEWLE